MGELILFYWAFKHAPLLHVPLCVSWVFLVSSSENDSFRKNLWFTADVLFIYFNREISEMCRQSARSFAQWSDL